MEVIVRYGKTRVRLSYIWVKSVIVKSLSACNRKGSVGVCFTDNKEISRYNAQYRHLIGPTDVLSFENKSTQSFGATHLGDIMISVEYVQQRLQKERGSLTKEIGMLLIHGTLHLCGFDHVKNVDAHKMFSLQNKIAKKVGAKEYTEHTVY